MSDRAYGAMLVTCHDCDKIHRVPELPDGGAAVCSRCGGVLLRHREESNERALALNVAALTLFGVANLFPLMTLRLGGQTMATTLPKGVTALYGSGMWGLAVLVFVVAILIPLLKLLGSIWILGLARAGRLTRAGAGLPVRRAAAPVGDDRGLPPGPDRRLGEAATSPRSSSTLASSPLSP